MSEKKDKNHTGKEIDAFSGVETTGHEWDGLKELNNPLPRWWLWVFYATIVWSVAYFVLYPAWPTLSGATEGILGYTQVKELKESQNEILQRQKTYLDRFEKASFEEIMNDAELYAVAMAGGMAAFKDNCATCHGTGAAGAKGFPNLNDDDWLWGGTVEDIYTTIEHGVRTGSLEARLSQMPAFGKDGLLTRGEINLVVDYVLSLSRDDVKASEEGRVLYQQNCASCHGADARGMREMGAPNLADSIWLYGGDRNMVFESVYNARAAVMPAWNTRLDENTIRQLAVYVHQLGGGEETRTTIPEQKDNEVMENGQ